MFKYLFASLLLGVFLMSSFGNEPSSTLTDASMLISTVWIGDYNDPNGQGKLYMWASNSSGTKCFRFLLGPQYVNLAYQTAMTAALNGKLVDFVDSTAIATDGSWPSYRIYYHQ
jgi:hypothetical protein